MIILTECECHPLPQFMNIKRHKLDSLEEIMLPSVGRVTLVLARPWRGKKETGFFVKISGSIYIVSLWRGML